ncbi:MAG: hypothetical protein ABSC63_18585 [Candidatus Binataceae bacterium]|jgi:hypothetical protein
MNLKPLSAIAIGLLFCLVADASFGQSDGPAPGTPLPQAATSSPAPQAMTSPQPSPITSPSALHGKFPLLIANYSSKSVDVYIGGGLKCSLPKAFKCTLQVPVGHYLIRFVREGGAVVQDSFHLPQYIAGKEYDGGVFLIKEDRVEFGAPNHR